MVVKAVGSSYDKCIYRGHPLPAWRVWGVWSVRVCVGTWRGVAWRQCVWCGWCGRPGRRCREIARLRGKSPKLRGSRHQVCPAGTPKEGHPFRGCSGGLIMLASAWERKESPVARGEIVRGDRAGRLRGDRAGRLCGEIAMSVVWCGMVCGAGGALLRHSQGK